MKTINPIYSRLCPVCGREVDAYTLLEHGMCSRCLVGNRTSLNALTLYQVSREELLEFTRFFKEITGFKPWGAQETWAKRLINRENTVIIAPTGMGKTTLLLVYALYMSRYGRKTLVLTPTRALARQVYDKLQSYSEKIGGKTRILFYDSSKSKKKREEILRKIMENDYDILVLTNNFMLKNYDLIDHRSIDLIIVDDVDSLLKSNKNIKKLIKLIGYTEELVEKIKEKHRILWKLLLSKTFNKQELIDEYIKKLIEIEEEIEREKSRISVKQVVIASATGRMRGTYAKILRDLLMIDVSGITIYGRNITDTYYFISSIDEVADLLLELGPGGLILISPRHPLKERFINIVEHLITRLTSKGYIVKHADPNTIKKFIEGRIHYLIGSSSYYGVSVRGIDAPETIKYVIFLGTPVFTMDIDTLLASPNMMIRVALHLYELTKNTEYRSIAGEIKRRIFTLTANELRILSLLFKKKLSINDIGNEKLISIYNDLEKHYTRLTNDLKSVLRDRVVVEMNTITFYYRERDNRFLAITPDVYTYIQASGRASRLYLGGVTHGLSIVIEYPELENLVRALDLKLGFYSNGKVFKPLNTVDLGLEKKLIIESRRESEGVAIKYRNILVVVESPTKAKTIARFFGRPVKRRIGRLTVYEIPFVRDNEVIHLNVIATRGHIFDLTTNPDIPNHGTYIYNGTVQPYYETIKKCRVCGHQFTYGDQCPRCSSKSYVDSIEVVNALRKLGGEANEVYIATDPDIEGEKIAYDVYLVLKGFNDNVWRIELHEITLKEFLKALENKRTIDEKLVEAEIYRRVLDRLIGFSLSQDLWREYGKKWFGAGRVQTPVLGWIIKRYREYLENKCRVIVFKPVEYPELVLRVSIPYHDRELYEKILETDHVYLELIDEKLVTVNPKPPYTTDQLIYDVSRIGLSSTLTMKIAQELFESGLITYHRTSSTYISSTGVSIAMKYLEQKGLYEYRRPSHWGEPGAHEAIRPVYPMDRNELEKAVVEGLINPTIPLTHLHYRVYDLIFKRFIASQMKPYRVLRRRYSVSLGDTYRFELELDVDIVEHGYDLIVKPRIYQFLKDREQVVSRVEVINKYIASTKPLYSEGEIVLEMKKNRLGRPSTYSKILSNIVRHGYVVKSRKRGYLIPTKTGIAVYEYLVNNYSNLVSVEFTRSMEERIDLIASGRINGYESIVEIYGIVKNYGLPLSIREYGGGIVRATT